MRRAMSMALPRLHLHHAFESSVDQRKIPKSVAIGANELTHRCNLARLLASSAPAPPEYFHSQPER